MVPELRARGIGEMLDLAVALYRARFLRLVGLTAIVVVPVEIFSTLVLLSAQPDRVTTNVFGGSSIQTDTGSAFLYLAATLVVAFVSYVSSAFVIGVCARPIADAYTDASGTWARGTIGGRGFWA